MPEKFPFPADLTRRERWLFEKHAHITISEFGEILRETPEKVSTQMEAALILIAVKRLRPQVTIDDVLDSDWELMPPPDAESEVEVETGADADPFVPPPAPTSTTSGSTNSPTPGSSASPGV